MTVRETVSTHSCEWCGGAIDIYYTTEATYNHYHFCTATCKSDFGNQVYLMSDRAFNSLEQAANGGTIEDNNTRRVLRKHGLVNASRKRYYLTQRGKRVLAATRKYKEKKSLDVT